MKDSINTSKEVIFSSWIKGNKKTIKDYCSIDVLGIEVKLPKINTILRGSSNMVGFGAIDYIFLYRNRKYVCECKYPRQKNNASFWDSLKVIGYTEYYNWMNGGDKKYYPAILFPEDTLSMEHKLICQLLKIKIFKIREENGGYLIREEK
jgi:rhodanese-related sulfurtransferase